ncbi:hypothetical protein [Crossiella cryophila]|uniref:Uncharacterized protein n=1 Tax=Crossiella cryophila TaxID=43355 RepID=A0A7W7FQH1_9PSEU|nr:hypothetical protein [Crossiella cryophila]MBB4674152.1 hypothetical protein [Crossiella cryophila]
MLVIAEVVPALLAVAAVTGVCRLLALGIALKGAAPADRPAIIRALAEFFRTLPRRRR